MNGTRLQQGEKKLLSPGDTLSIGGFEMKLNMPGTKGGNTTQVFAPNKTPPTPSNPQKESMPALLVGEGKELPLKIGLNMFGRKSDSDVQIADAYVSGKHGIIEITDDGIFITDIGSTNGTMLNDAKLSPNMRTSMTSDDIIRLGTMEFKVRRN